MWTLANGMRVIFKKMPVDDVIYYSMSLNGGYGNIQNLSRGEGAYLSDYLRFCRIGGVRFEDFQDLIRKKGMTMDCEVNLSNTIFKGHVPDDGLDYLLQMLASVMYDRTLDKETFDYQVSCEPRATSTNADSLSISSIGFPTVLMSIPLKSMHTPSEIVNLRDIKSLADIVASIACNASIID